MSARVSHQNPSILTILRKEYLDITNNFCAAKLIEYFRHWTEWKIANHRTPWIYQPLKRIYADLMGEHSIHVIRTAISLLESLGILNRQKNPGNGQDKTWQYKLNLDVLHNLLEHRKLNSEPSEFTVEPQLNYNPHTSNPPQQHVDVENIELPEVNWEAVERETDTWEQSQILGCVDELEEVPSDDESISSEDSSPPATLQNSIQNICTTTVLNVPETSSDNLTTQQIKEVCTELKLLRINPDICLGVVKKYWDNVAGALARVKEAINQGWCSNPTGLFIIVHNLMLLLLIIRTERSF